MLLGSEKVYEIFPWLPRQLQRSTCMVAFFFFLIISRLPMKKCQVPFKSPYSFSLYTKHRSKHMEKIFSISSHIIYKPFLFRCIFSIISICNLYILYIPDIAIKLKILQLFIAGSSLCFLIVLS